MESTTVDNFAKFELINKDNYFLFCLYDLSNRENNDEITPDGYAKWTSYIKKRNVTIKEYLEIFPDCKIVSRKQALRLQQRHYEKKYNAYKPYITNEENFLEKLNVLPPEQWEKNQTIQNHNGKQYKYYFESFKLIEAIAENIYSYYALLIMNNKARYFKINLPNQKDQETIKEICFKHFLKLSNIK